MRITVTVGFIKKLIVKYPIEDLENIVRWENETRQKQIDLADFAPEVVEHITEMAQDLPDEQSWPILRKIKAFKQLLLNPTSRKVAKLEDLAVAMKSFLSTATNHWLFAENDGFLSPCFISDITYEPYDPKSESPANVEMTLSWMQRGDRKNTCLRWYKSDLRGGRELVDLIREKGYALPAPELIKAYEESMEKWQKFQTLTGGQFVGSDGMADGIGDRWDDWQDFALVRDGVPDKLVMDDLDPEAQEYSKDSPIISDGFWDKKKVEDGITVVLPIHPVLKVFNLDRHAFGLVHVDQLTPYQWNPGLGDSLILPSNHKDVIQILMDTASEEIDDIIAGKSGGTICICTGEPGTGKTLTAEVMSEVVKRPLYKVNCSQLGTDEEAIESELNKVLTRAARWKALLLIDEADVYVRTRDNDIQQNAIVGVFLRVLEYYRGILFLTSNRAVVIDDAILSRATVHIKYEKPNQESLNRIWSVLNVQFKAGLSDELVKQLVKTFPNIAGRDVKNMLKLVIRFARRREEKITLKHFKQLAVHKDITAVEEK